MAKFIGIVLLLVIVLGYVVPSFFLSPSYAAERATLIAAAPGAVAAEVADFNTWESWTAWDKEYDPTMTRTITGTPGTVGHRMEWTGDKGKGWIQIKEIAAERIVCDMQIDEFDPSVSTMHLEPSGDGATNVRWELTGEFTGQPFKRWFGLMMDGSVGPDYEKGLERLKARIEGGAAPAGE